MNHVRNGTRRRRQSARRHFRNGHRAAVVRATTAARLYLRGETPSLAAAAEATGSNVPYIQAAITLLKADDPGPLNLAIAGWISLPQAAAAERLRRQTITVSAAVSSWREWSPEQRAEFGRGAGVANIWDDAIVPTLTENRASQPAAE
jgi:hypothetical protein